MTTATRPAPEELKVTQHQAAVWDHITEEWLTVAQIHGLMGVGSEPVHVALNTVKNTVKWLLDLGVIVQAPNITPARYRFEKAIWDDDYAGRYAVVLNQAVTFYEGLDE